MALDPNALITVADAKVYLQIDVGVETWDAILEKIINGTSTRFDNEVGRTLKQTAYTDQKLDGNGQAQLSLPQFPIADLSAITLDDVVLVEGTDFLIYSFDNDGYLELLNGATWTVGKQNVKLTYKGGFSTVPKDLALEVMKQAALEFQIWKEKTWGESSRSFPDGSISYTEHDLLKSVERVLRKYMRPYA